MNARNRLGVRIRRLVILLLCLGFAAGLLPPAAVRAAEAGKVVRVGWHEEPYFIRDDSGRCSGYTYDYQQKLVAYTGWQYEYVTGSWSELTRMLKEGEIDLLGNVSYTEARAEEMLFATLPMGTEAYYLFVPPDSAGIRAEDYGSLNGKRVGVAKGSIQCDLFRTWAEAHGVRAELVEMTCTEDESLALLGTALDAFVTMDISWDRDNAEPLWKIGASDFFFAVSRDRPDLLAELNAAMSRIQDENRYFNQALNDKYLGGTETNYYLNDSEAAWLADHGVIRVGYQDKYLAFCAADETTGQLTGALKDYLDYGASALENARLTFEAVSYPTAAAAVEALQRGEVDCVFPANLTEYESEILGVVVTPALMTTEMDAVVRAASVKEFLRQEQVTVAVNRGNTNYEMFLADHYPGWQTRYYEDTPAGLDAVAAGEADCVIISNYRYNNVAKQCERLHLTTVYTGVDLDYCVAVQRGETELYSILAKLTAIVPASTVHTALTYYSSEDVKTSFADLLKDNLLPVSALAAAVLVVILFLLLRSIRAERKAIAEERTINALNRKVFVDALTSVRNKGAFDEYLESLQARADREEGLAFAVGVFDCDDLKSVNDQHGHDKGDEYLKAASRLICRVFQHSPVFRIGGDEFAVVLLGEDFQNREALAERFRREKDRAAQAEEVWERVRIALGIAVYDPKLDRSTGDTVRRADQLMYEEKRRRKAEAPQGN